MLRPLKLLLCIFLVGGLIGGSSFAFAASSIDRIAELKKEIEQLTKQADQYQLEILSRRSNANTLKHQIANINADISHLQKELELTGKQITATTLEIGLREQEISDRNKVIEKEKKALIELMQYVYQQQNQPMILSLIESKSISEFTARTQQANDYTKNLNTTVADLKDQIREIGIARDDLNDKKIILQRLQQSDSQKKGSLGDVKTQKNQLLTKTKGEEKVYQQMLSTVEKRQAQYFKELKDLEAQAYKDKAFIVHVTVANLPAKGTMLFKPPLRRYVMTQKYGYTAYAKGGAYAGRPHSGDDLVGGYGAEIYSIGEGKIVASGTNSPGWGNWVAVQHDNNFVSVYAHMKIPTPLAVGTRVNNDTVIGYEGSTGNSTGSHVHLSLYRDFFTFTNPKNGSLNFNYIDGTVNPQDYIDIH